MRWSVVCRIAAICVASVGCGEQHENDGSKRVSPERVTELENHLRTKPPFEAAQDEYRNAMRGMADQIAALVPGTTWNFVQDTFTDCGGDYVWTDAKEAYFLIGFSGPIPDEKWDHAVQIVKDGTSRFGATNLVVAKNNSGDHDVSISGSDGVDFKLSSQKAGSPDVRTAGCEAVALSVQPWREIGANVAASSHSMCRIARECRRFLHGG